LTGARRRGGRRDRERRGSQLGGMDVGAGEAAAQQHGCVGAARDWRLSALALRATDTHPTLHVLGSLRQPWMVGTLAWGGEIGVSVEVKAAWGRWLLRVTGSRLLAWSTDATGRPALRLALKQSIEGTRVGRVFCCTVCSLRVSHPPMAHPVSADNNGLPLGRPSVHLLVVS